MRLWGIGLVLALTLVRSEPADAGRTRNLLGNGDFSTIGECSGGGDWASYPDCAAGWTAWTNSDATIEWFGRRGDRDVVDPAIRMTLDSGAGYQVGMVQWKTPVVAGEIYLFTALAMGDDLRSEVLLEAQAQDAAGNWLDPPQASTTLSGSFVWRRLELAVAAPPGATQMAFRLRNQTTGACRGSSPPAPTCGTVWFDDAQIADASVIPAPSPANLCPEGQFLKLSNKQCLPLARPTWGFDPSPFQLSAPVDFALPAAACNGASLVDLVDAIREIPSETFVRLILPPCEIDLTYWLYLRSNMTLQGAGVGKTRLRTRYNDTGGGASGVAVRLHDVRNVVVRDLTLDGERSSGTYPTNNMLGISNSANVLIERVEVLHAGATGIVWKNSPHVTVRYSAVSRSRNDHGIGSADCKKDVTTCPYEADFGEGRFESDEYQVLSNWAYLNRGYAVDVHAMEGEVAGNLLERAILYGGMKAPDAVDVLVRHNRISGNTTGGFSLQSHWRMPDEIVVDDNTIVDNGQDGIYAPIGEDVYLRRNYLARNGFAALLQGIAAGQGGVAPFDYLRNVTITDNTFFENAAHELRVGAGIAGTALVERNVYLTTGMRRGIRLQTPGVLACFGSQEEELQLADEVAENPFVFTTCN
jgi:hypothetical protein